MKFLRTTVVLAAVVSLATSVPAGASTSLAWQVAKLVALPKGAHGIPLGYLPTLSCPSAGNCVAGGAYAVNGGVEGLIISESNGVWKVPVTLQAPLGAAKNPGITIYGLSCGAVGNCAVTGSYQDRAGDTQAFYASETGDRWSLAHEVTLPANALGAGQNALLRSVACSSRGNCSAVGDYQDRNAVAAGNLGFVVSERNGKWTRASEIATTRANFNPFVTMSQVACSSPGNCEAVGSFVDANGATQGLLVSQVGGAWRHGVTLALPGDASTFTGVNVSEVTCVRHASCALLGTFNTTTGDVEGLSASEAHGVWSRAGELTMPPGAASNPHVFLYGFNGIACSSTGNCSAGGQYQDGAGDYEGFLDNEVAGTWASASELALPSGARYAGKNGGVIALSCPTTSNCRAGAAYVDSAGNYQALVVEEVDGVWTSGLKVVLPGGATTVGVDGGLYSLVCPTATSCTGTGSFLQGSTYQGFTLAS